MMRRDLPKPARRKRSSNRLVTCGALLVVGALSFANHGWSQPEPEPEPKPTPQSAAPEASEETPKVLSVSITGPIGPATTALVTEALERAREEEMAAVVLQIDTPGGLVTSTRAINTEILASRVPVIGYVAPSGAHAASAGTFILYATGLAAMAPGTNIGAATPVQMGGMPGSPQQPGNAPPGGGSPDKEQSSDADEPQSAAGGASQQSGSDLANKAKNDSAAYIVSLAELHGRNADWAEKAVREAATLTASAALEKQVVELVVPDLETLLQEADGRAVLADNREVTLKTAGADIVTHEPGFLIEILSLLANPNIAFILMLIGVYGLIFEFANPGTVGPGVIGAMCLILGLYALNQLPLDYAGLGLVGLGLLLMAGEAISPSFGILGLGGVVSFIIGSAILIDTDAENFQLAWSTILVAAAVSAGMLVVVLAFVVRAFRARIVTGAEEMIGARARVLDWQLGKGHVHAHGERWQAQGPAQLSPDEMVEVRSLDGLTLTVIPLSQATASDTPRPSSEKPT